MPGPSGIAAYEIVTELGVTGQFMKSPAPAIARSRSSTSARNPVLPAQASARNAERSSGDSISRARPKIDLTSAVVVLIVSSFDGDAEQFTSPTQCDVRDE